MANINLLINLENLKSDTPALYLSLLNPSQMNDIWEIQDNLNMGKNSLQEEFIRTFNIERNADWLSPYLKIEVTDTHLNFIVGKDFENAWNKRIEMYGMPEHTTCAENLKECVQNISWGELIDNLSKLNKICIFYSRNMVNQQSDLA